ncbi:MAG: flagellar hook-associated protein FlgK [Gammaproteobacteria bacterium]|nr:flagellar hook-associated protein FlgK [Gammaproteobacteria bacterium]
MTDFLNTGVSGLIAFQRALATTSHNIANANTVGFSRQQALLAARPARGTALSGLGTEVTSVRRIYDQYLVGQVQTNTSAFNRLQSFHSLAAQVDDLLAGGGTSVGTMLQDFFNALDTVADDPAGLITREAFLGQARALTQRFEQAESRLNSLDRDVNNRVSNSVSEINALADSIAQINEQIVASNSGGRTSSDLLDQRDNLLTALNGHIAVTTVQQDDGAVNVFVGNGLVLVRGSSPELLATTQNEYEPTRLGVKFQNGAEITSRLSGGEIGGALDFRREVLDPARNALGRLANGITEILNTQHREGIDLAGARGGDMFAVGAPVSLASAFNSGAAPVTIAIDDIGALTTDDYILRYDGAIWSLENSETGAAVTMTGTGTPADPFRANGLAIEVGAGAAAGDRYLLRPNSNAAAGLDLLIDDPAKIAAAAAIISSASTANTGDAQITIGEVINGDHPNLLNTVNIVFVDSNNFTIGALGPFPYTNGNPISFNGWRVEISGTPQAGDTFTVTANTAGNADNRNALLLSDLQSLRVLDNGTSSLGDSFGTLVASVGTVTQHAAINRDAQQILLADSEQARLAVSGVNLDEEAANLLRFEQAYQAAAQVISVADQLFQTLIGAVAR